MKTSGIDGLSFSMPAGQNGFWGQTVIYNTSDTDAVLKDARPIDPPPGLQIVDVLIAGPKRKFMPMSGGDRWPDESLTDLRSVAGTVMVIPPVESRLGERGVEIVVVVRPARPGRYLITKLDLTYRVGHRDHRRTVVAALALCARTRVTDANLACPPADLSSV